MPVCYQIHIQVHIIHPEVCGNHGLLHGCQLPKPMPWLLHHRCASSQASEKSAHSADSSDSDAGDTSSESSELGSNSSSSSFNPTLHRRRRVKHVDRNPLPDGSPSDDSSCHGFFGFPLESGTDSEIGDSSEDALEATEHNALLASYLASAARRAKTAKARAASIFTKTARKLSKHADLKPPPHRAEAYRPHIQADSSINKPGQWTTRARTQRLRLLISYLRAWCAGIMAFLNRFSAGSETHMHHAICSAIVDDTNMKLSNSVIPSWVLSRTVAVMNIIQSLIVCYHDAGPASDAGSQPPCQTTTRTFNAHTPLICLPRSDTETLASEFMSRLVLFLGRLCERFHQFGLVANFACSVPIQALAVCMDALATNLAVIKQMRTAVLVKQKQDRDTIYPFLQVCCLIHQLALSRRILLNGFPQFYSSIVRLAHLFEVGAFRLQFRKAMLSVIHKSFSYVPVLTEPPELRQWRDRRNEIVSILGQSGSRYNRKRIQLHQSLMFFLNGDPDSDVMQHFCNGNCCEGQNHAVKARHALLMVCKYCTLLFTFGFPVPLAYRWVHAHRALQFCRDAPVLLAVSF